MTVSVAILNVNCELCIPFIGIFHIKADNMQRESKGALHRSVKLLQNVRESRSDVYDFDQQDTSRISSSSLQSKGLAAKFRPPLPIRHDAEVSRKSVKNKMVKMPHSADVVIEASHSGKTSTPCPVMGHQKTKKKRPGTPVPWVELCRLQQDSLAAYAVSPIAVEHNSPNDLSRQIGVNSMFDDTLFVMDDSAVIMSKSDDVGTDHLPTSFDKDCTQHVVEDSCGEAVSQEYKAEKQKSEIDSGFPKFDSQCEFVSLLATDDIGTVKEKSKADKKQANFPAVQNANTSGDAGNIGLADSDCEVVMCKPGALDPKRFNSSDARSMRKCITKRKHQISDVEPSDESADSDIGVSSDVKPKNSVKGKLNRPSHVLRTRSTAVASNYASDHHPLRKKDSRTAEKNAKSVKMSNENHLRAKKPSKVADMENDGVLEQPKSRHRPPKKNNTESQSWRGQENVGVARDKEEVGMGLDSVDGDAECKCIALHWTHGLVKLTRFLR